VELLSGKPVELGPDSAQWVGIPAGLGMQFSHAKLLPGPEGWGSQLCMAPVVPHGAGAQQSLRGGGLKGRWSQQGMDPVQPERQRSRRGMNLAQLRRQRSRQGMDPVVPCGAGA
jgi:hypothetical protein